MHWESGRGRRGRAKEMEDREERRRRREREGRRLGNSSVAILRHSGPALVDRAPWNVDVICAPHEELKMLGARIACV